MDGRINLRLNLDQVKQPVPEKTCLEPVEPGRLDFPNDAKTYEFTASDLTELDCIGTGSYGGVVMKMIHKNSGSVMAVKRVRAHEIDTTKREQMLRELRIIIESQHCEDVVRFFGALFQDGDCWICMELLDCSLDKFYRRVFKQNERIPEKVIGFITTSVVRALNYLRVQLNIIHRDVKPSNILLDQRGFVKICDFGISGYLVDSIAKPKMWDVKFIWLVYGTRSDVGHLEFLW
uniref:mitogen-activated protein kinase kinase n=1 Tax=Ditylenchus dipsaci TaxID=166011 RepID=A0A915DM78_9BILA